MAAQGTERPICLFLTQVKRFFYFVHENGLGRSGNLGGRIFAQRALEMGVKQVEYRGMLIKAGAFEVVETGRFIVSVSIARDGAWPGQEKAKFFEPPSEDGFFDDPEEGLECAVAFARAIIDGEIPGLTVEDV
jgi:hypothetical protein